MPDRPKFQRRTPDARRSLLVEATLRCLARVSVDRLSIRLIAAEAQVSVGLINHHYASKDALLAEAYRRMAGDLLERLAAAVEGAPRDPAARLDAFFRASFSPEVLDPKLLKVWTAFWIAADRSADVQAVHDRTFADYRGLVERLLADLSDDTADAPFDMRLAALGLSALLDGLWLEWCLNPNTFTPAEGIRLCRAWAGSFAASHSARGEAH